MDPILATGVGLALLIVGGELLVRGAVRIAEFIRVSPLFIGIVLVGFGTSAPEMATSIQAARVGSPGIAIGNFVGSSISNILLILGLSALLVPIAVTSRSLSRDGTVVVMTAVVFAIISVWRPLDEYIGSILLLWLIAYLIYAWRQERYAAGQDPTSALQKAEAHGQLRRLPTGARLVANIRAGMPAATAAMVAVAGLAMLIFGSRFLVDGAIQLARHFDVSEAVIGLTIVAIGTSMPELVTSLVAAARSQPAVAVGNIMGSNIYNILGVGGLTGVFAPTLVPERIVTFDNIVMVGASILLIIFARSGFRISRLEGAILFLGYGAYLYTLWPVTT
ncbi:MAG: calcium/sodium antiporter [Hyphomicrobiaceae bacterium]